MSTPTCTPIEAGCDIHAIAENIAVVHHYIALVNADPKFDPCFAW
jgi:hypothetical protein